jgi:hypothetical protein
MAKGAIGECDVAWLGPGDTVWDGKVAGSVPGGGAVTF